MTRTLTEPLSSEGDPPRRRAGLLLGGWETELCAISVLIGLLWAIDESPYVHPPLYDIVLFVAGLLVGGTVLRRYPFAPWAALGYATIVGIVNRAVRTAYNGSDVVGVTGEAIGVVGRSLNPYAHTYIYTNPRGSPFPYLPGELAWYALAQHFTGQIIGVDKWAGMGIVVLLALLALRAGPAPAALGTALYGTFDLGVWRSLDGSNDTSLAFLVLLAVVLLAVSERFDSRILLYASALAFTWALLFKAFAWFLYPFVVNHLRRTGQAWKSYLAIGLGGTILVVLPFFLNAPRGFVRNMAAGVGFHQSPLGLNVWTYLADSPAVRVATHLAPVIAAVAVLAAALILLAFPAVNLSSALVQGCGVLFVSLLLTRYATSSYYAFGCAVLVAALVLWLPGLRWRLPDVLLRGGRDLGARPGPAQGARTRR